MKKSVKKQIKRKVMNAIKNVILAMIVIIIFIGINIPDRKPTKEYAYTEHVVQSGERIWNLSNNYIDSSTDKREYIEACEELNNKSLSELQVGETIKLIVDFE